VTSFYAGGSSWSLTLSQFDPRFMRLITTEVDGYFGPFLQPRILDMPQIATGTDYVRDAKREYVSAECVCKWRTALPKALSRVRSLSEQRNCGFGIPLALTKIPERVEASLLRQAEVTRSSLRVICRQGL
jgi:hypothetical protein